jgi:hypothetical protein
MLRVAVEHSMTERPEIIAGPDNRCPASVRQKETVTGQLRFHFESEQRFRAALVR